MKRKFRLAQLLKYRKSIEDQRNITLAMIEEKRYREQEKLFRLREAQRSHQKQLQHGQTKQDTGLFQSGTAAHLSYLDALSQESLSRRKMLEELKRQALEAKEELLEASKARKIVEKLRDRELERDKQSVIKQERKQLDEIAAERFIRMSSPFSVQSDSQSTKFSSELHKH